MKVAWSKYKRNWGWFLLIGLLLAAAFGYFAYAHVPDYYVSSVGLYVQPKGTGSGEAVSQSASQAIARDCTNLLQSPELRQKIEQKVSPDVLDDVYLFAEAEAGSHLVQIRAYSPMPDVSQRAVTAAGVVLMERMEPLSETYSLSIAERAQLSENAAWPQRNLWIGIVFLAVFVVLSLLFLLLVPKREMLHAENRPEAVAGVPILGAVADYRRDLTYFFKKSRNPRYAQELPAYINRASIEDIKNITLSLNGPGDEEPLQSLVVASENTDEGKSSLAALIGMELCNQGSRVLMIEMDCYAPTLGKLLRVQGQADLIHHLGGEATLDQVILATGIPNLFFIDNCHIDSYASRMIGSPAFEGFLDLMYEEFDYIIFDAPPASLFADAASLGSVLDGTLMVAANNRLTAQGLKVALERFKKAKNNVLGVVLTFAKAVSEKQYREYEDTGRWS